MSCGAMNGATPRSPAGPRSPAPCRASRTACADRRGEELVCRHTANITVNHTGSKSKAATLQVSTVVFLWRMRLTTGWITLRSGPSCPP